MLWVWFIFPSYSVPPNRTNLQDAGRIIRPHGSDEIRLRHVAAMTCFILFSPFAENHKTFLLRLLDSLFFYVTTWSVLSQVSNFPSPFLDAIIRSRS
jgi:hypothetical protein